MILSAQQLSIHFGMRPILQQAAFYLEDHDKVGIVGLNGAGKSTLLRLLAGVEDADAGQVILSTGVRRSFLPQRPDMDAEATVLTQVMADARSSAEYECKAMLQRLGLEDTPWTELIAPAYTGPLQEPDVAEDSVLNCGCDLLLKLDSSCQAKVHAGPGRIKNNAPNAPQDPEVKFIFDMDLSMNGQTPCTLAAAALETLHGHSTRLFEGAVTDRLRDAMEVV